MFKSRAIFLTLLRFSNSAFLFLLFILSLPMIGDPVPNDAYCGLYFINNAQDNTSPKQRLQ
ncbi:hypothetical protein HMPREF9714_01995 [Myroides odoratimimus CCUG 12901]|uniref:Secreted protein n=1 Tax=Myroides odoratimimus CCUG 10230 TaxID=883150 RepID=A0ABN0E6I2_9FLAO|nr:hypothetical protein HMPREF9712_03260 [Myroides odoratimimus CCUG 10230]EHO09022.1 hypothetical protein HMPREF9714_01995 [Myroides odoratimimus CCUG 12901]